MWLQDPSFPQLCMWDVTIYISYKCFHSLPFPLLLFFNLKINYVNSVPLRIHCQFGGFVVQLHEGCFCICPSTRSCSPSQLPLYHKSFHNQDLPSPPHEPHSTHINHSHFHIWQLHWEFSVLLSHFVSAATALLLDDCVYTRATPYSTATEQYTRVNDTLSTYNSIDC